LSGRGIAREASASHSSISPRPAPAESGAEGEGQTLITLGRLLFFDPRLSANRTQSCASCHQPELAYTDARKVGIGSTGEHHTRNVPTLTNVGARGINLERQAMRPLLRTHPIELGALGHEREIMTRFASDASVRDLFAHAFPNETRRYTLRNAARAIAAFERTLSSDAPFDRAAGGDHNAMTRDAWRGLQTFSARGCASCHAGTNFSRSDDVPTLRNVMITAPYLRDGSANTIDEVFNRHAPQLTCDERTSIVALLDALSAPVTSGARHPQPLLTAPPR
jgi:cytochrome c peroxidase